MKKKKIELVIKNCARCGEDHSLVFFALENPSDEYTHFSMCPKLKQPILLKIQKIEPKTRNVGHMR